MNRTVFSLYIVSVFMLATGFSGCKNEKSTQEPKDYHIKNPENILTQYNTGRPEWDWTSRTIGSIKFDVRDSVIIVHHVPTFEPEVHYYFLQVNQLVESVDSGYIEKAEIIYLDRHLLVNSLESKKTYIFSIESDSIPDYLKGIDAIAVRGYGLGVRKFNIGAEGSAVPFCNCVPADFPTAYCRMNEMSPIRCATSTETGSCEVHCGSQAFACCDMKKF